MSRMRKRALAVMLAVLLVVSAAPMTIASAAGTAGSLNKGDSFLFGTYPQTRVTDVSLISRLNSLAQTAGDVVTIDGETYQAQQVDNNATPGGTSTAEMYGYASGQTYWFRCEPITWRVLDKDEDSVLLMSERVLCTHAYNDTVRTDNTWENSDIRAWLNGTFMQTAFSAKEQTFLLTSILTNEDNPLRGSYNGVSSSYMGDYYNGYPFCGTESGNDTIDKVFLPSFNEITNKDYGFNLTWTALDDYGRFAGYYDTDSARQAIGTDFAKCQGVWASSDGNGSPLTTCRYWLRTAGFENGYAAAVLEDGRVSTGWPVNYTIVGIRPMMRVSPDAVYSNEATESNDSDTPTSTTYYWSSSGLGRINARAADDATEVVILHGGDSIKFGEVTAKTTETKFRTIEVVYYPDAAAIKNTNIKNVDWRDNVVPTYNLDSANWQIAEGQNAADLMAKSPNFFKSFYTTTNFQKGDVASAQIVGMNELAHARDSAGVDRGDLENGNSIDFALPGSRFLGWALYNHGTWRPGTTGVLRVELYALWDHTNAEPYLIEPQKPGTGGIYEDRTEPEHFDICEDPNFLTLNYMREGQTRATLLRPGDTISTYRTYSSTDILYYPDADLKCIGDWEPVSPLGYAYSSSEQEYFLESFRRGDEATVRDLDYTDFTIANTDENRFLGWVVYSYEPALNTVTLCGVWDKKHLETGGDCGAHVSWLLNTDGILTVSGTGAMADYSSASPAPWEAFRGLIRTVAIGGGVTHIGDSAFRSMGFSRITIPESVTSIGAYAFASCACLTNVTIPSGVREIGAYAFLFDFALEDVTLENGVETIGEGAFSICGVTRLHIPASVLRIADAVSVGSILSSADAVALIHAYTSGLWPALTAVTADADNPNYTAIDGVLYSKDRTQLLWYPCAKPDAAFAVPDGVTAVKACAFDCAFRLKKLIFPASAAQLGADFSGFSALRSEDDPCVVYLPANAHWAESVEVSGPVTVARMTDISIRKMPMKKDYLLGDSLNLTGLALTAIYDNGETMTLPYAAETDLTTLEKPGTQTVTLSYGGCSAQYDVYVQSDPTVPKIAVQDAAVGCSAGRLVKVSVNLQNNPGIIATRLFFCYDTQQLRPVGVENGTVFGDAAYLPGGDLTAEPYTVLWSDDFARNDITANGTLVTLTFEVQPTATVGDTDVTVICDVGSTFNTALQRVTAYTIDGSAHIVDCAPGDTNEDGEVNLMDSVLLNRFLADGWGVTVNEVNADVNGDTVVDLKDVVLIRRFLAGWDVSLI